MGDHHSHDIFTLIHSLTNSEWKTLMYEVGNSPVSPLKKGQTPKYLEIIQYFKTQEKFDDQKAKTQFGYNKEKPAKWRDIKRDAIRAILKAIERAGENQTKRYLLQKAPTAIQKLIEKELWWRAEKSVNKFIEDAKEFEQFEILIQLLSLKQLIVMSIYPDSRLMAELKNLQELRNKARITLQNIDTYHDIWYTLSSFARANDLPSIQKIYESIEIQMPDLQSNRSRRIYLQTWQMAAFCLGLKEDYLKSIYEGIQFCTPLIENPEEFDFISFYIKLHFEKCVNNILRKEEAEIEGSIAKLEKLKERKNLPNALRNECNERLLLLKLFKARNAFDKKILFPVIKELEGWYAVRNSTVGEATILRLAFICAESLFHLEEYSLAVKWLIRIRRDKQSTFRPGVSSASWMLYMLIRFDQGEWGILSSQIVSTRKYLEKYEPGNEYYRELLSFFDEASRLDGNIETSRLSSLHHRLKELRSLSQFAKLESYFSYSTWIEAKMNNRSFHSLYKENLNSENSSM